MTLYLENKLEEYSLEKGPLYMSEDAHKNVLSQIKMAQLAQMPNIKTEKKKPTSEFWKHETWKEETLVIRKMALGYHGRTANDGRNNLTPNNNGH